MFEGVPSLTALAVLSMRALSSLPGSPSDHVGDRGHRVLVPGALDRSLDLLGALTARSPATHRALRALTVGLADHVALRTDAIDRALLDAIDAGCTQLVILGAGLDARAYRMDALRGLDVFEVDVKSTQAIKRRATRGRRLRARGHRFVEVDFERDALEARLLAEGFDPSEKSVWIWEGVTPYLPRAAIEATLHQVARLADEGSRVLVTYVTGEMVNAPTWLLPAVLVGFEMLGEPLRGRLEPDELAALGAREGLRVIGDTGSRDWARAHYRERPSRVEITERLAVLER
ncbi:MAG: SAM-dependent methyltransferase [Deltaproteobacteria bacterium]|nr:SAM-dependent methyltransferase [Deltaproteobacteria bacterium]